MSKVKSFPVLVILMAGLLPAVAPAARLTERWVTVNPLRVAVAPDSGGVRLLDATGFWGEFAAYRIETDIDHAYNVKLGGFVEMFRVGRAWSLAFLSSAELVASSRGDLFFRPRAVFWEEGFVLTRRSSGGRFWQVGYMHRCKHDVDNLGTRDCDGGGCERSLIYGSVMGKLLIPIATAQGGKSANLLVLRGDLFTILQDDRNPGNFSDRQPNEERAWGAFGVDFHGRRPLHGDWLGAYVSAYGSLQLYGEEAAFFSRFQGVERTAWHAGVSSGVALQGKAHLRLGVSYEYMGDTSINPDPESSHLLSLSVTLVNSGGIW